MEKFTPKAAATPAPRARRGPVGSGRSAQGQAPALSRTAILQTALELVADSGVAGLSTRKLAVRLQCQAMSIYHHFPSKQHLLDALVDHVIGTMQWPPADLDALQQLRAAMFAFRAMAHQHPAFFPYLALHRLNTPAGVRFIETILGLVQAVIPDARQAARHFRAIGYYLVGAALDETAGYARGPSAAQPVDDAFIATQCPRLAGASPYFQRSEWDATFELGVQALLHSVAQAAHGGGDGP